MLEVREYIDPDDDQDAEPAEADRRWVIIDEFGDQAIVRSFLSEEAAQKRADWENGS